MKLINSVITWFERVPKSTHEATEKLLKEQLAVNEELVKIGLEISGRLKEVTDECNTLREELALNELAIKGILEKYETKSGKPRKRSKKNLKRI